MSVKRFLLKLMYFFATLLVFFAILVNAARIFLPKLDRSAYYLEAWASKAVDQPVEIKEVKVQWRDFFEPEISFSDVRFLSKNKKQVLFHVDHLAIGIDVVKSLFNRKLYPSNFILDGLDLTVRHTASKGFFIEGISASNKNAFSSSSFEGSFFNWLAAKSNVLFKNVRLNVFNDGEKSFSIYKSQFELRNTAFDHYLLGEVFVENKAESTFSFVVNFDDFSDIKSDFSAHAYFNVHNFSPDVLKSLSSLGGYFKQMNLQSGLVSFRSWVDVDNSQLVGVKVSVKSGSVKLYLQKLKKLIDFDRISGDFFWKRRGQGWEASADNVDLGWGDGRWFEKQLAFSSEENGTVQNLFIKSGSFQAVQDLARHFGVLSAEVKNKLDDLQLKGKFSDFFSSRAVKNSIISYSVKTKANNISLHDKKDGVDFSGLSGSFYYSPVLGYFDAKQSTLAFSYPKIFSRKMSFDKISGLIFWKKKSKGYEIGADNFLIRDDNFGLLSNGRVWLPRKGGPVFDLLASFYLNDLTKIKYYFPGPVMNKPLKAWLLTAFKSGNMKQSTLLLRGPISKFPFRHHEGRFEISSNIQNLGLQYAPGWPVIKNTKAHLSFDNAGLGIKLHSGNISGINIVTANGGFSDLVSSPLVLKANLEGDLSNAQKFVNNSPMLLKEQLADMKLFGSSAISLNMNVPLHSKKAQMSMKGSLAFKGSNIQMPLWGVDLTNVYGSLGFTNSAVFSKSIAAKSFGYPVSTSVSTSFNNKKEREVKIDFKSSIDMANLYKTYSFPILSFSKGVVNYNGRLLLHDANDPLGNTLTISSDLKGVSFDVPKPYAKKQPSKKDFSIVMHAGASGKFPLYFEVNYGKLIRVVSSFTKENRKYNFWGGKLLFGSRLASLPESKDWSVSGVVDELDWPVWQKFLAKLSKKQKGVAEPSKGFFNDIQLRIKKLLIFNKKIDNVNVNIKPYEVAGYDIDFLSSVAAGNVKIPAHYEVSPVLVDLNYFHYNPSGKEQGFTNLKPTDFFPVNFSAKDFFYKGSSIGAVSFKLKSIKDRLRIEDALIESNSYKLAFNGDWLSKVGHAVSSIDGSLSMADLGNFLSKFDLSSAVAKGKGAINFSLSWPGSIFKPSVKGLNGGFSLDFSDGRIVNLNNETESELGLGKLLGLFSVRSISEKLLLNFGGLVDSGFPFSRMAGDFQVIDGLAKTQNFSLDGSIADVLAEGSLDLPKKTYNIAVTVRPYLTSSLPVIAAVVGTPIIGAAAWVVNKVIVAPLTGKIAESKYQLKGSWAKPKLLDLPKPQ